MTAKLKDIRRYRKAPVGAVKIRVRCLSIMQEHEHVFERWEHERGVRKCQKCRELEAGRILPAIQYCKVNRDGM